MGIIFRGGILAIPTRSDSREVFDPLPTKQDGNWITDVFDDSSFEEDRRNEFLKSTDLLSTPIIKTVHNSIEHLMLLPPRVYGYALLDHKWLALDVNLVSDLSTKQEQNTNSRFEDLVLPKGHKMILQALIKNQVRVPTKQASDASLDDVSMDVVPGKGKGLIILLHGVPGVGKTSTAECVAALLRRPLLPITCGDIGTRAKEAEEQLESFCALAQRWRCVLLLDEADVFLAKREKGDIERNSLVSGKILITRLTCNDALTQPE